MALFGNKQKRSDQAASEGDPADAADLASPEAAFEREACGRGGIRAVVHRPAASKRTPGTLEKLATLHGSRARLKRLCAEALKVILEAFGVRRGALLIYDPHRQCLALAAERGLGQSGKQCLRRVRRDDPLSWDMPLHGLLNERAYLIEDPAENRYVPQLLEVGNHRLARVACVPIYRLRSPVGAFVLLTGDSNRLTETEIRLSYVSLRYVAMIIDDAREREGASAILGSDEQCGREKRAKAAPVSSGEGAPPQERYAGLLRQVPAAPEPTFSGDEAPQEILLTEEIQTLGVTEESAQQGPDVPDSSADGDVHEQDDQGEVYRLRKELAGAVANLERSTAQWKDERDQVLTALRAELSAEHERGLASVQAERDELAARVGSLAAALESAQAELRARVDDAARIGRLDSELATAREAASERARRLEAAESDLEAHRCRIEELEGELSRLEAELAAQEQIASGNEGTEGIQAELAARAAERERILSESLEQARCEWGARETTLNAEIGHLREQKEAVEKRLTTLEASLQESSAALDARTAAEAATRKEVLRLREAESALRQEVERRSEETEKLAERIAELDQILERAAARSTEIEANEAVARREAERWREEADSLGNKVGELERVLAEKAGEFERVMEGAAARSAEMEAREAAAREEAAAWRAEAETLGKGVTELDEKMQTAAAEAELAAEREQAARQERERLHDDVEKLRQRTVELSRSLETLEAEKARLEEHGKQAQAEAARWRKSAEDLERRVAAIERQRGETEGEGAAIHEHAQKLEEEIRAEGQKRTDLEAQVARLEAERRAAYAEAARARDEAQGTEQRVRELESERNEYAESVKILEAAVARLEAGRAIDSQQQHGRLASGDETDEGAASGGAAGRSRGAVKNSGSGGAKGEAKTTKGQQEGADPASASPSLENERFAVIEPSDDVGHILAGRLGSQARAISATGSLAAVVRRLEEAHPTVAVVNLGSRGAAGGFNVLQALRQSDLENGMRIWAYVAPPQAAKAIALGFIQRMPQPSESKDLAAWLKKLCGPGARVLSVGLEMDGLLSAQEQVKRDGISLSMAWDSKQGQELLEMVNPSSVVVNLDLPRGDGYRTLGRMAVARRTHTWVLCGGETPPSEAGSLVATGATQGSAARFLALPDIGSALLDDLRRQARDGAAEVSSSGKGHQKPRGQATASGARGRNTESGVRRSSALGSQRRMSSG